MKQLMYPLILQRILKRMDVLSVKLSSHISLMRSPFCCCYFFHSQFAGGLNDNQSVNKSVHHFRNEAIDLPLHLSTYSQRSSRISLMRLLFLIIFFSLTVSNRKTYIESNRISIFIHLMHKRFRGAFVLLLRPFSTRIIPKSPISFILFPQRMGSALETASADGRRLLTHKHIFH